MPHFLNTQANELINWFTTSIHARTQLAVLLRKLIQSTGHELQKVDFPGNDDAERPGWDGFLETSSSNAWIPDGISGWEFGVTESITKKADGDFEKSVRATNDAERRNITFVFVTPRRWQGKVHWVKKMKGKNLWKDIRAYDASDLEQWMEQSVSSRIWFANETGRPSDGVRTLERCWADWANVTDPYLHSSLFATAIQAWNCEIKSFFEKCDSKPLVITADSMEEALAFLKQVFDIPELEQYRDRVLVFDKTEILPKIAQETTDFIVVAHTREVERELAPYCTMLRSIVVYPRNAARVKSDIVLEPLGTEPFRKALESMGKSRDDIAVLEKASGRSLTVLRRQLSNVPAIGTPEWADDSRIASDMVPLVLSRRGHKWAGDESQAFLKKKAKEVYDELLPKDILNNYEWLFRQVWFEGTVEGVVEEEDFQTREKEVQRLRIDALTEIARERGIPGILELSERGNSRRLIGAYLVSDVLAAERVQDLILTCLRSENNCLSLNEILAGALWSLNKDRRKAMLASLRNKISEEELLRLLLLSPYRASTWEIVDQLSAEARNGYWVEVIPQYSFDSFEENNESIRRLLEVKRPRAAFASVRFNLEKINPSLIIQMLSDMLKNGQDKEGEYLLNSYDVREAFQLLDRKSDLSLEEKARLEFSYLGILDVSSRGEDKHGIPNLELYTEQHPELFVQAIVWTYKRKNSGEDLIEGDKDSLAQCGYRFLEAIERIPGLNEATKKEQQEKLSKWVEAVRRACADLDRLEVADEWLGNLFSHAPVGEDGVWPDEAVRNVMENIRSQFISRGAHMGLFNSRGAHFCGKGGAQERELANKYRVWADALQFTHPFVSSSLLMSMVYTYECEAERLDIETEIRSRVTL